MAVTINSLNGMVDASYDTIKETFPVSIASTSGTVSSVNGLNTRIIGSGTVFLTDVKRGYFIWFTTTDEIIEVESVTDDTTLTLKESASTLTGVAWKVIPKNPYSNTSWGVDSVGAADINGITYEASMSKSIGGGKSNGEGGGKRITPILIDSTANSNVVFVSAW